MEEPVNLYQVPQSQAADEDLRQLMTEYIFQNTDYYDKYIPDFLAGKRMLGFNWAAALFATPWMAYRKMYLFLVGFLVLTSVITAALSIILGATSLPLTGTRVIMFTAFLLERLAVGLFINAIYLEKVRKAVLKCRNTVTDSTELKARLNWIGGTSSVACVLVVIVSGALGAASRM